MNTMTDDEILSSLFDGFDIVAMLRGYLECALWASNDEHGNALDDVYTTGDISDETKQSASEACGDFVRQCVEGGIHLDMHYPGNAGGVGHDLFLTRNRHGAGFWDRGLGEVGDELTEIAHIMGGSDFYVGDDGQVYAS
jgi:hypothetical protein